jgi:hypothetical protein
MTSDNDKELIKWLGITNSLAKSLCRNPLTQPTPVTESIVKQYLLKKHEITQIITETHRSPTGILEDTKVVINTGNSASSGLGQQDTTIAKTAMAYMKEQDEQQTSV